MQTILQHTGRPFFLIFYSLGILLYVNLSAHAQKSSPSEKSSSVDPATKHSTQKHIVPSNKHTPNQIKLDLDGDTVPDTVTFVQNLQNKKYGLEIRFGNGKKEYLAMGKELLGQGFDDLDGIGIFKIAPRGNIYWNNVNEEGDIIDESEVKDEDKIKLKHDGIYIHEAESCGGGVIYFEDGKFKWIQQE